MATDDSDLEKVRLEGHVAFVVGYTGETGKELVKALSMMKPFSRVLLIGRRKTNVTEKLGDEFEEKIVDFDHLEDHEDVFTGCDIGFNCLGTTRGKSVYIRRSRRCVGVIGSASDSHEEGTRFNS